MSSIDSSMTAMVLLSHKFSFLLRYQKYHERKDLSSTNSSWQDWCAVKTLACYFLYQHGHNKVASFIAPPSLPILHPKFLPPLQCRLQSPLASLSYWTLASNRGHYVYMQQLQQLPLQSSQNNVPGQNQLYWTPTHIGSAGKSLTFPFLALEKFLQKTPACAATILLVRASPLLPLASCLLYMVHSERKADAKPRCSRIICPVLPGMDTCCRCYFCCSRERQK